MREILLKKRQSETGIVTKQPIRSPMSHSYGQGGWDVSKSGSGRAERRIVKLELEKTIVRGKAAGH